MVFVLHNKNSLQNKLKRFYMWLCFPKKNKKQKNNTKITDPLLHTNSLLQTNSLSHTKSFLHTINPKIEQKSRDMFENTYQVTTSIENQNASSITNQKRPIPEKEESEYRFYSGVTVGTFCNCSSKPKKKVSYNGVTAGTFCIYCYN